MFRVVVLHETICTGNGKLAGDECTSVLSRISVNEKRSIMPSKIQIGVRPFLEMPAHTYILSAGAWVCDNGCKRNISVRYTCTYVQLLTKSFKTINNESTKVQNARLCATKKKTAHIS